MKTPMLLASSGLALGVSLGLFASPTRAADDFPPFEKISEGYEKVAVASGDGAFYSLYKKEKEAELLAELPADYEGKRFYLVATIAGGDPQAGVYSIYHDRVGVPTKVVYWARRGDQLALIEPNLSVRSTGDGESKSAVARVNTDRVVLSVPIMGTGPGGGPVIDLDRALMGHNDEFFGGFLGGANQSLARITKAKVFPKNIEIGFELPNAWGQLVTVRYSLGMPDKAADFVPRIADRRVGIYYQSFEDRAVNDGSSQVVRYADRWHLKKADPSLKLSPPEQPIVYYIEHTTPIRYRRWVREGILAWNKAFERVGILGAIEVRQQDATSGAYMDIDPEDIRYSFVRWTNASIGFAIGPSHAHPDTGQIYEADIVMDEGFIGGFANDFLQTELASNAMSVLPPSLSGWLAENPDWDPRVILAEPGERERVKALTRALAEKPESAAVILADAPLTMSARVWEPHRGASLSGRRSCYLQGGMGPGVALARLAMDLGVAGIPAEDAADGDSRLDGLPESFVGPLLRDVIMHEVGHTMGMMHNWKGSTQYTIAEMNTEGFVGPINSTVMDYAANNIIVADPDNGLVQGPYVPMDIGTYDLWAIEWNYTFGDPKEVAARAAEPGHAFIAEDGQFSPDPHAKVWDLGRNSIDFADQRMRFVNKARGELLTKAVKDGESWEKARRLYQQLLGAQSGAVSVCVNWVGGVHITRSMKGDEGAVDPVRPVDVAQQRRALKFIVENALNDQAFGLDPAMLAKLQSDNWYDEGYESQHAWSPTQSVLGIQASAMTGLLNPQRLSWIMDNEIRTPAGQDALTVPEVFNAIHEAVWTSDGKRARFTEREPMISTLDRHLQTEHLNRMISLATGMSWPGASGRTVQPLARAELRKIAQAVDTGLKIDGIDAYSKAHLEDAKERIARALEAAYIRGN